MVRRILHSSDFVLWCIFCHTGHTSHGSRERIKIAMQMQVEDVAAGGVAKYSSSMDCFKQIVAEEGLVSGMYKGTMATLARDMPGTMGWYGAYYFFKNFSRKEDGTYSTIGLLNAGGFVASPCGSLEFHQM